LSCPPVQTYPSTSSENLCYAMILPQVTKFL
jgi:hypothetical protein